MKYDNVVSGIFLARPNRFIAHVIVDGEEQVCHVKNTGRCAELLIKGVEVFLQKASNPDRKTKYDLIAVRKGDRIVNIDSQAPNKVAAEFIPQLYPELINLKPEAGFGSSRLDFKVDFADCIRYIEVKGVTLEADGIAMFPDAPTERGVKHLNELIHCVELGYKATALFIIQMTDIKYMIPNDATHPEFGKALRAAKAAGVDIIAVGCDVTPDTLTANGFIDVRL